MVDLKKIAKDFAEIPAYNKVDYVAKFLEQTPVLIVKVIGFNGNASAHLENFISCTPNTTIVEQQQVVAAAGKSMFI